MAKKEKTGKGLFIASVIIAAISLGAVVLSTLMIVAAHNLLGEIDNLGEAFGGAIGGVVLIALSIIFGIGASLLGAIGLANAIPSLKFSKSVKSIVMVVITSIETLFIPIWFLLTNLIL